MIRSAFAGKGKARGRMKHEERNGACFFLIACKNSHETICLTRRRKWRDENENICIRQQNTEF